MYSKAPIKRTGHWAVLAVHTMYCHTGIRTGTYNRNFRVSCSNLPVGGPVNMNQHLSWLMRNENNKIKLGGHG